MPFIIIYITHPDEATAKAISNTLIDNKLVACANIFPIQSSYWWEGAIQREDEYVSIVKTTPKNWQKVVQAIEADHPYDVPCIMKIDASANAAYEKWIADSVI